MVSSSTGSLPGRPNKRTPLPSRVGVRNEDLIDEPRVDALLSDVGTDDNDVLAAGGLKRHGDRGPDVAREERDTWVLRPWRTPVGQKNCGPVQAPP